MRTDENSIKMALHRISHRPYFYLSITSRYLFCDSRQRIITYVLIFLCFFTPSSSSFVLFQGTTQKIDYKDITMLKNMRMEDRRIVYEFCQLVIKFPHLLSDRMSEEQLKKSKPICQYLLKGLKELRASQKT